MKWLRMTVLALAACSNTGGHPAPTRTADASATLPPSSTVTDLDDGNYQCLDNGDGTSTATRDGFSTRICSKDEVCTPDAGCQAKTSGTENNGLGIVQQGVEVDADDQFQCERTAGNCAPEGITWVGNATQNGLVYNNRWHCDLVVVQRVDGTNECHTRARPRPCAEDQIPSLTGVYPSWGICLDAHPCNNNQDCGAVDETACTTHTCVDGFCELTDTVTCEDLECQDQACNPDTGICEVTLHQDNSPCTDGNACTQIDTCLGGECVGSDPVLCPEHSCQDIYCNELSGACEVEFLPNTTACDDGSDCTAEDQCLDGNCVAEPVVCENNNPCQAGECQEGEGCIFSPLPNGSTPEGCDVGACLNGVCVENFCQVAGYERCVKDNATTIISFTHCEAQPQGGAFGVVVVDDVCGREATNVCLEPDAQNNGGCFIPCAAGCPQGQVCDNVLNVCIPANPAPDMDQDGVLDGPDNCPEIANADQADLDQDGIGNVCDPDIDGDGVLNGPDNCDLVANADQADTDQDGIGNACDPANPAPDMDQDGVLDGVDNCPEIANADQADLDQDGIGNVCDPDIDGDGVLNGPDNCDLVANADQADTDQDGIGNACDGPFPDAAHECQFDNQCAQGEICWTRPADGHTFCVGTVNIHGSTPENASGLNAGPNADRTSDEVDNDGDCACDSTVRCKASVHPACDGNLFLGDCDDDPTDDPRVTKHCSDGTTLDPQIPCPVGSVEWYTTDGSDQNGSLAADDLNDRFDNDCNGTVNNANAACQINAQCVAVPAPECSGNTLISYVGSCQIGSCGYPESGRQVCANGCANGACR